MFKKIFVFLITFIPLMVVNGYCLTDGYFEKGNTGVNVTLIVLFLVISFLISFSKLFFDFFLTVITARCTGIESQSSQVLKLLLDNMIPQWIFTLVCLVISRLAFGSNMQVADLFIFAAAHTIYYSTIAYRQIKATGKKAFGFAYGSVALVCWTYVIINVIGLLNK